MSLGHLTNLLDRLPFVPFKMVLSTGIVHEVRYRELVFVDQRAVTLEFPGAVDPVPLASRRVIISLRHIVQIETLEPPPHD